MVYKLFNEKGLYVDKDIGEPRNLLEAGTVYTPEGINVGQEEFSNIEQAMEHFNVELAKN